MDILRRENCDFQAHDTVVHKFFQLLRSSVRELDIINLEKKSV